MRFAPRAAGVLVLALAAAPAAASAQRPAPRNPHVRLNGKACTDCHTTSGWREVRFDHRQTSFPLLGQHQTVLCAACHDLRDFSGATSTCGNCHTDPHRGDAGPRCEQCHSEVGWRQVGAQNAHARTRFPELGVHTSLRCEDCHRQTGANQFTGRVTPCVTCHQPTYNATTQPAHAAMGLPTQCEVCHQFTTWSSARFPHHDAVFPINSGTHVGTWTTCATCHTDPSTHTTFSCMTGGCHAATPTNGLHQGIPSYAYTATQCLSCHPTGLRGAFTQHDPLFFPVYSGTHVGKWTVCADCHTDPATRATFTCMTGACHTATPTNGLHQGIPGYAYTSAQCRSCHPTGVRGTFTGHDALFFPIYSGAHAGRWSNNCAVCHADPLTRATFTCMTGACHAAGETNSHHTEVRDYFYVAASCYSCHPRGTSNVAPIPLPMPPGTPRPSALPAGRKPPLEAALRTYRMRLEDDRAAAGTWATSG